jgi:hypothetical protein
VLPCYPLCSLSKRALKDQTKSLRHGKIYQDPCMIFSTDPPSSIPPFKDLILPERVRFRSMFKLRNSYPLAFHAHRKFFEVFIFLLVRVPLKLNGFRLSLLVI